MKWKYCTFCGNLGIKKIDIEKRVYRCPRCDWEGIPDDGDITLVNTKARNYTPGTKWIAPRVKASTKDEKNNSGDNNNKENSNQHKIVENLEQDSTKVPKNKEILDRIKDKDYGDAEFI